MSSAARYALYRVQRGENAKLVEGQMFARASEARAARKQHNREEGRHPDVSFAVHVGSEHPPVLPLGERLWLD